MPEMAGETIDNLRNTSSLGALLGQCGLLDGGGHRWSHQRLDDEAATARNLSDITTENPQLIFHRSVTWTPV